MVLGGVEYQTNTVGFILLLLFIQTTNIARGAAFPCVCLGCLNSIHNIIIIIRVKIKSFHHKAMLDIYERGSFSLWSRTVLTNSDGCRETCWYALSTFHIHDLYKTIYFNSNCLSAVKSTVRYCFHEKSCHLAFRHKKWKPTKREEGRSRAAMTKVTTFVLVAISACCQIGGCLAYYGSEFEPLIGHQHLTRGRMTSGKGP